MEVKVKVTGTTPEEVRARQGFEDSDTYCRDAEGKRLYGPESEENRD